MMWAIGIRFLRGVCVATDTGQWDEAEWPPHPARLHMALAATYFETCQPNEPSEHDLAKRRALEWLEKQPPPRILASEAETRAPVTVFVPVNDSTRADQLLINTRSRQPRHFPASIPHRDTLYYVWDGAIKDQTLVEGLERVAFDVSRLGHSSSLVQAWVESAFDEPLKGSEVQGFRSWTPSANSSQPSTQLRVASAGSLGAYERSYNAAAIEEFVGLETAIKVAKGKEKTELRKAQAKRFPHGMPNSQRPSGALPVGYHVTESDSFAPATSCFDSDMMVLALDDAPTIGLESTLKISGAIRKKIHDAYQGRSSPEWLGGHTQDGAPSDRPHLAIVPLPFVGRQHADGHLLGAALVFPRHVSRHERAMRLRDIFERTDASQDWAMNLRLNNFRRLTRCETPHCDIRLVREQRLNPPRALQTHSWTRSCTVWETVTPIVLDRFPKRDRLSERQAWNEEVAAIIASSCENVGLPQPAAIRVDHNASVLGVPRSRPDRAGFPTMAAREGKPSRYQVHARIEFDIPLFGPVLLGAGRFVGYGFCRPNVHRCKEQRQA